MFYVILESSWPSLSSLSSSDTIIPLTNEHHVTNKRLVSPEYNTASASIRLHDKHLAFCNGTMGPGITPTLMSVVFNHNMISCGWPRWGLIGPLLSVSSSGRSQGSINPNCIGWLYGGMDVKAQDCHYLAITGTNLPCSWVTPAQTGWGEKWYNQDGDGRESLQTHYLSRYRIMSCTYICVERKETECRAMK